MRTSYSRENKEDVKEEVENEQTSPNDEGGVTTKKILEALERNAQLDVTGDISEEPNLFNKSVKDDYEDIFADDGFDLVTPDYHKISMEVDLALREDYEKEVLSREVPTEEQEEEFDLNEEVEEPNNDNTVKGNEDIRNEDTSNLGSHEGVRSYKRWFTGTVAALVVVLGVTAGVKYLGSNSVNDIEDLENKIEKLYTSNRKDDLKSNVDSSKLDKYYSQLDAIEGEEGKEDIKEELDTISYYIADKAILDEINSSGYDFNSSDMETKIEKVRESAKGYNVYSLSESIYAIIDQIENDYFYFLSIRDEISLVSDYSTFDVDAFQLKINKVSHTVNKQELQSKLDSISNSIKITDAVSDIKDASTEKLSEAVDKASNDFIEKLDSITESLKELVPNIVEGLKSLISGDSAEGN